MQKDTVKLKSDIPEVPKAFAVLKNAMAEDPDHAHSWHCNIAMCCYDSIISGGMSHEYAHKVGNDAASRFMKLCFGVETKA